MATGNTQGFLLEMTLKLAKTFLFYETRKKAILLFCGIFALSMAASFVTFPEDLYIVQKHSIFNQYGVKIGWFWTWVVVAPFIFYSSKATGSNSLPHFYRLFIATFLWWFCIGGFHRFLFFTSSCDINSKLSRSQCSENNGKWTPGIDISGHCFLMVYSMLIMSEESTAFRNWQQTSQNLQGAERTKHEKLTQFVQYSFIGMFLLSSLWIKQLVISTLYYHVWYDKAFGALFAIGCWALTYRIIYPKGYVQSPINRQSSTKQKKSVHHR